MPSKLNDELTEQLCNLIEYGVVLRQACYICGVSPQNVYYWLKQAEKPNAHELYSRFFWRLKRARALCEAFWIRRIHDDNTPSWQRFAFFLERSFPQRWARRDPDKPRQPRLKDEEQSDDEILAEIEQVLAQSRNGSNETNGNDPDHR